MFKFSLVLFAILIMVFDLQAQSINRISIGQGISMPGSTNFINWNNGFTSQNPMAASYVHGLQLTGEFESGDSNGASVDGYGAELVYGGNDWGVGVGFRDPNNDTDDDEITAGVIGLQIGNSFGFGIRGEEDHYSVGLILNPDGTHRIGIVFDALNDDGDTPIIDEENQNIGLGYAYVSSSVFFVVDASKREFKDATQNSDIILASAGIGFNVDALSLSVTYDTALDDENDTYDDNTWFGIAYEVSNIKFEFYSELVKDWSVALTYKF